MPILPRPSRSAYVVSKLKRLPMSDQVDLHSIPRTGEGEPKADVLFVHGLDGNPFATWWHDRDKPRDSWPYWLAEDVPEAQVHCLRYPADWTHWFGGEAMPLFDRGKSVLNLMAASDLGRHPIVFICHSLGGLVVKQLLRQADERGAEPAWRAIGERTRGVVLIATPHAGADPRAGRRAPRSGHADHPGHGRSERPRASPARPERMVQGLRPADRPARALPIRDAQDRHQARTHVRALAREPYFRRLQGGRGD